MAYRFLILLVALSTFSTIRAQTLTLSLGDLQQYTTIAAATTPVLNGTSLSYSAGVASDQGLDVFLSPELQNSIQTAVSANCQEISDQCFQAVKGLLVNPNTEIQARTSVEELAVTIFAVISIVSAFLAGQYLAHQPEPIPVHVHIPPVQLSQAANGSTATVTVVSIDNTPAFTITPKPEPTGVTGSITPAVTTFTTGTDGHSQGDVLFSLPSDLATRMDEFIRRSTDCDAGTAFDTVQNRRRADDFGAILCSAQALIINAVPGGPFADFRLINAQQLPFTVADAIRAMTTAMNFAAAFAPALSLDEDTARNLAVGAIAMAWEVLSNGQTIGAENIIPAQALGGTITAPLSPSSTATSTCSVCVASCSFVGVIQACGTTCSAASSCASTTTNPDEDDGGEQVSTTATIPFTVYGNITTSTAAPTSTVIPNVPLDSCDGGSSSLPYQVFDGMYGKFCTQVDGDQYSNLAWNVDNTGNKVQALRRRSSSLIERSPPPNPDTYKDWKANLNLVTTGVANATCIKSCSDAFKALSGGECGQYGGLGYMSTKGSIDVLCGTYSYEIIPPPPPPAPVLADPTLGDQQCNGADAYGKHPDISESTVTKWINEIMCKADQEFTSSTAPLTWNPQNAKGKKDPYHYSISWIAGCETTATSQQKLKPLPDQTVTCYNLLYQDYKNCLNGGVGGYRDAGCLRYEFNPSTD